VNEPLIETGIVLEKPALTCVSRQVLGVDPGLAELGLAILNFGTGKPRVVDTLKLTTTNALKFSERLKRLRDGVLEFTSGVTITCVAIEDQEPGRMGARKIGINSASAERVRDVAGGLHFLFTCPVVSPRPQLVNSVMGYRARRGVSHDEQRKARKAATRRWVEWFLGFEAPNDHVADAITIAVAGERLFRRARAGGVA
jgi:Holliday junction resolvasome RuvABC endonuclease subunit